MSPEQRDKKLELLKNQVKILSASFQTIQVFASNDEPGEEQLTARYSYGHGNWFARYGQVKSWILSEEGRTTNEWETDE